MSDNKAQKTGQSIPDEARGSNHFSICKYPFKLGPSIFSCPLVKNQVNPSIFEFVLTTNEKRHTNKNLTFHNLTFGFNVIKH